MNVRVRFLSVATGVAFASGALPLAAQSAMPAVPTDANAAIAPAQPSLVVVPRATLMEAGAPVVQRATDDSVTLTPRGPSVASARVAVRPVSTTRGAPPVLQNRTSNRNAVALMIVGGAALVVGAVIGDDAGTLVMLGGAAVGLYGLYMFLT